jgi:glycosyltransferase involved in cell wall biosynthesis
LSPQPVAILHYAGPPGVGGVELTMAAHARFLADRDRPVRILAGAGGQVGHGIETVIIPEVGSRGAGVEEVNLQLASGTVSEQFTVLVDRASDRLVAATADISVMIAHNVLTLHKNLALTSAMRRLHDAGRLPPMIAWCHDFAWIDPLYQPDLHDGRPWDLLRRPWPGVQYVAVSEARRRTLADLLGVAAESITVVPPGIDVGAFFKLEAATAELVARLGLLAADPFLLLPARVTRRKNMELAVAITAALRQQGMAPVLVVTGPPGPHDPANAAYLAALRQDAGRQGVGESVVFLHDQVAHVAPAMISDLFRLADALLFPSRMEGFGIPLLEAGLSRIPIFCSDLPVFREVAPEAAVMFSLDEPAAAIAARIAASLGADPAYAFRRRVRVDYPWSAVCERGLIPLLDQAAGLS